MTLTLQTAKQAGQLAATLDQLNNISAMLRAAVAAGASMQSMLCTIAGTGDVLQGTIPFSVVDTATIFNTLITIAQNNADAITAQLESM